MCMDADLQHEPEAVPVVAKPVLEGRAEFSVGSRNTEGGGVAGWSMHRKAISAGATLLALPLTRCKDPMSGFFATTQEVLARGEGKCNAMGFKIGLELMVKCGATASVTDVPITFRDRVAGESKLSMKQNVLYVRQLLGLYFFKFPVASVAVPALLVALAAQILIVLTR